MNINSPILQSLFGLDYKYVYGWGILVDFLWISEPSDFVRVGGDCLVDFGF